MEEKRSKVSEHTEKVEHALDGQCTLSAHPLSGFIIETVL
jgi:hypothetical protein